MPMLWDGWTIRWTFINYMATRSYAIGHHHRVFMWIGGHVLDVHTI